MDMSKWQILALPPLDQLKKLVNEGLSMTESMIQGPLKGKIFHSSINNRLPSVLLSWLCALSRAFCQNEGNVLWKVSQISHLLGSLEMERPAVHITAPVFLATPGQREPQAAREGGREGEKTKRNRAKRCFLRANQLDFNCYKQELFKSMTIFEPLNCTVHVLCVHVVCPCVKVYS